MISLPSRQRLHGRLKMGFAVKGINSPNKELKQKPGSCQVSLEPVEDVKLPNNATQGKTLIFTMGIGVVVLLGLYTVPIWRCSGPHGQPETAASTLNPLGGKEDDDDMSSTLPRVISRAGWESEDRVEPPINLNLPVPFIVTSHTGGESCQSETECSSRVRMIQMRDLVKNGFSDIGFNFLIGGDGNVYEGRGWNYVGAHTWSYNTRSLGISLIGNFSTELPTDRQLLATQQLIKLGVHKRKVARDYKLIGHRQNLASHTTSPGEAAYNIIKTWPHWVEVSVPNRTL